MSAHALRWKTSLTTKMHNRTKQSVQWKSSKWCNLLWYIIITTTTINKTKQLKNKNFHYSWKRHLDKNLVWVRMVKWFWSQHMLHVRQHNVIQHEMHVRQHTTHIRHYETNFMRHHTIAYIWGNNYATYEKTYSAEKLVTWGNCFFGYCFFLIRFMACC